MLKRLCLSPLTSNTFSMEVEEFLQILHIPMIFPLLFSRKVTSPLSFDLRDVNCASSPVMCLEHPLSKYQWSFLNFAGRHTYKKIILLQVPKLSWVLGDQSLMIFLGPMHFQECCIFAQNSICQHCVLTCDNKNMKFVFFHLKCQI